MWTFDSETDPGYWVEVDSPTNVTLRDVTGTANGPVAVGDKGVAVGRGNDRWGVILENGPGARSRALHAVDATDDGERVYFAGAGGSFGYYDLRTEQRRDYSQPRGNANTFYALAVAGDRGEEKFLIGDGSGNVVPGWIREGEEMNFDWETAPNSGNAIEALAHDDDGYGYAVDVNSNVFMTTEDDGWDRVGVDDAQGSFYDCAFGDGVFLTGGGNGMVFEAAELIDHGGHESRSDSLANQNATRSGDGEATWTPTELGGFAVYGLDAGYGGQLACGEGGSVFVRRSGGEWARGKHDGGHTFRSGLIGEQMVVVGSGGLIVERRGPDEATEEEKARHGDGPTGGRGGATGSDAAPPGDDGADEGAAGSTSTASATNVDGAPAEDAETVEGADGVESDIDWTAGPKRGAGSGDGDPFDGRGENYDGDAVMAGEGGGSTPTDGAAAGAPGGDSGNDPADEPDGGGNDPADEPDGGNDESDEPDPPDDSGDDSGNDDADPPDENTDSDADSPD